MHSSSEQDSSQENSLGRFLASRNYYEVPLRKISTGHLVLEVYLNGMPGLFVLDSGAGATVVDEKQKEFFRLDLSPDTTSGAGAGGSGLLVYSAENNKLQIGEICFEPFKISAMDFSHVNTGLEQLGMQEILHGVIGADVMEMSEAVIDYKTKCLYLKNRF